MGDALSHTSMYALTHTLRHGIYAVQNNRVWGGFHELHSNLAAAILDLSPNPYVFLLFLNVLLLLLGCFMAAAPVIIMVTPIILPGTTAMGLDPIHAGVVMVLNLMIGLITPSGGLCLFAVAEVAEISPVRLMRALVPFFVPLLASLLAITLMPGLVLTVPRLFGFAN
ncbi:MAG: hypothetical protein AcusKO_09830 [Acuticoccus sp.]